MYSTAAVTAADEVDDLDTVAVLNNSRLERVPLENPQVVLDRDPSRVDGEAVEQLGDRHRLVDIEGVAVQRNTQLEPGI